MALVRMMQSSFHQIIDVVAVRDRLVAAIRAVLVAGGMTALVFAVRAVGGIAGTDFQCVFLDHIALAGRMMEMAVVQKVHVPVVLDGSVAAVGTVFVVVVVVSSRVGRVHEVNE